MAETVQPYKILVPFDEADGEGIVFFGNYFRLAHRALEHFLPQIGIPWKEWFASEEYGVPLRHTEADYMQPLRPGDSLEVTVKIAKIGESSIDFTYEFRNGQSQPTAVLRTAHVFVSRTPMKKIPIPANIRANLEQPQ